MAGLPIGLAAQFSPAQQAHLSRRHLDAAKQPISRASCNPPVQTLTRYAAASSLLRDEQETITNSSVRLWKEPTPIASSCSRNIRIKEQG
jgi:hypothetical protein